MSTLRRLIARAIQATTPTMETVARLVGLSSSALRRYRLGDRTPSAALLRQLAQALRKQAERLQQLAAQLDRAATEQQRRKP